MQRAKHVVLGAAALVMMVGLCGVVGCSTAGMVAGGSRYSDAPYIIADDPLFGNQIKITAVNHQMAGDLMRAHVTIKSNRRRSLQVRYKFSWYDENGVEVDSGSTPYRDVVVLGRDSVSCTSMAPNSRATEFKFRVQKVKAVKVENVI